MVVAGVTVAGTTPPVGGVAKGCAVGAIPGVKPAILGTLAVCHGCGVGVLIPCVSPLSPCVMAFPVKGRCLLRLCQDRRSQWHKNQRTGFFNRVSEDAFKILNQLTTLNRSRNGEAVGVVEIAAHGQPEGNAGHADVERLELARQI